ncbi:MAG: SAM-dependent methyltransferase, partial [Beijerinckiaceae bacterium]
ARDDGALFFIHAAKPARVPISDAPEHAVVERGLVGENIMADLAARLVRDRGAALVIDYGHALSGTGDTLQAVRRHQFADIFAEPGEADLTAHVDFAQLKATALANDAHVYGPATQGAFLRALGIEARAHTLASRASASQCSDIQAALQRLTSAGEDGMGELFKVLAVTDPQMPRPPGFEGNRE